jgi:ribosomal protein L23
MNLTEVIIGTVSTEKAERLKGNRTHMLHVHPKATKIDVSNALRKYYNVESQKVRIIKVRAKKRLIARGRFIQKRDPVKRALVTLSASSKPFDISNFQI